MDIYRVRPDGTQLERLTDDPAFDDQAAMSPDGNLIAFVSSRSGQADVWLMDVRTRAVRNLSRHPGGDYRPAWSPDGRWIAFTSDREHEDARDPAAGTFARLQLTQIYRMRPDGSDVQRLTQSTSSVGGASWSPDGDALAFFEANSPDWMVLSRPFDRRSAQSQIVSIDVATRIRTERTSGPGAKLTPQWRADGRIAYFNFDAAGTSGGIRFTDNSVGPDGQLVGAHWSADGKRMVFQRTLAGKFPFVVPAFSRDPQFRLLRTGAFPSFSPDGRRIVCSNSGSVSSTVGQSGDTHSLFVIDADGANGRVLFTDKSRSVPAAAWSPRGDRIAFSRGVTHPNPRNYGPSEIATIAPDGSGLTTLTPGGEGNYGFPSWSPDGKRLVMRMALPQTRGLAIFGVESHELTPLTAASGSDNLPSWSPKGDSILFTSHRDGDFELYSVRADGTALTRITRSRGDDAHGSWSDDARWIVFSSARGGFKDEMARGGGGEGAADIFVMRADGSDVRRLTDDATEEGSAVFAPR
jgi:Tol biopolymer transport system component